MNQLPNAPTLLSALNNKLAQPISEEEKSPNDPPNFNQIANNTKYNTGRWTNEEHSKFLHALQLYGKEWKKVQEYVGTRTSTQARSHAQKFFFKLDKSNNATSDIKGELSKSPKKRPKHSFSEHPTPVVDKTTEVFKVSNDQNVKEPMASLKVTLDISQFNFPINHSNRRLTFGGEDIHIIEGMALSTAVSNEEPMTDEMPMLMTDDAFPNDFYNAIPEYEYFKD